ncbi:MAG: hypothetical protein FWE44_03260, partial [Defluviitaleaceae bacterium]|nr:hypothetical protein [Defluviitaleaceae bacterium]
FVYPLVYCLLADAYFFRYLFYCLHFYTSPVTGSVFFGVFSYALFVSLFITLRRLDKYFAKKHLFLLAMLYSFSNFILIK